MHDVFWNLVAAAVSAAAVWAAWSFGKLVGWWFS